MARPKKIVEPIEEVGVEDISIPVNSTDVSIKSDAEIQLEKALEMISQMSEKMAEMQKNIDDNKNQPIIIKEERGFGSKKIKCINLLHNPLNVSTGERGKGKVYSFEKYGDSKMINGDHLYMICESYPRTMELGALYICDSDFVEDVGLSSVYESKIYTPENVTKITYMRDETDVDMFLNMNDIFKQSIAVEIARNLSNGERIDFNFLEKIKQKTEYDISKLAEEIKAEKTKYEE